MKVTVMSRDDAIRYCRKQHNVPTVMISVSDPYIEYFSAPFCNKENKVIAIQRLYFQDNDNAMTDSDAYLIKRLLNRFPGVDVIVHCEAGVSRSAGIAAAILKAYTDNDDQIFNDPKYRPNMHCYRLVYNELVEEDE